MKFQKELLFASVILCLAVAILFKTSFGSMEFFWATLAADLVSYVLLFMLMLVLLKKRKGGV